MGSVSVFAFMYLLAQCTVDAKRYVNIDIDFLCDQTFLSVELKY